MAPRRGLEPPTYRLTAECSTIELPRKELAMTYSTIGVTLKYHWHEVA